MSFMRAFCLTMMLCGLSLAAAWSPVDYGTGPVNIPVDFTPTSPVTSGDGQISGIATFNVPAGIDSLAISLNAGISAQAGSGQTSFIAVLSTDIAVATVPEPASLSLLAGAASLLIRRRRYA